VIEKYNKETGLASNYILALEKDRNGTFMGHPQRRYEHHSFKMEKIKNCH